MPFHQTDVNGFKSDLSSLSYGPLELMVINFTCNLSLVCVPPRWSPLMRELDFGILLLTITRVESNIKSLMKRLPDAHTYLVSVNGQNKLVINLYWICLLFICLIMSVYNTVLCKELTLLFVYLIKFGPSNNNPKRRNRHSRLNRKPVFVSGSFDSMSLNTFSTNN